MAKIKKKVFDSSFWLTFSKPEITQENLRKRTKTLLYYNKLGGLIFLLASIITSILNYVYKDSDDTLSFEIVKFSSYFNTFVNFVTFLICVFSKDPKVLRRVHYVNYIFFIFTTANFKYPLVNYVYNKTLVLMIVLILLEILFRLVWVVISLLEHKEFFILNSIEVFIVFAFLYPTSNPETRNTVFFNLMCYAVLFIVITIFSFIIDRQKKISFYYQFIYKDKAKFFKNVFDTINTGIISIQNNKLVEMNIFLQNIFYKYLNVREPNESDAVLSMNNEDYHSKLKEFFKTETVDCSSLLKILLEDLNQSLMNDKSISKGAIPEFVINNSDLNQQLFTSLSAYMTKNFEKNKFILLGEKKFEVDNHVHYFEIHCRNSDSINGGTELTLLLNDVTRARETQNAEVKFKTLFLSKVAHEFKNPLICLTEIANQLSDQNEHQISEEARNKVTQIKSMSNFLLVLVKDLNYFSELEYGKDISIEKSNVSIDELLNFCENITLALLKNLNKINAVKFYIKRTFKINQIVSDEWRIKQILINFLSNAAKFTYIGEINLELTSYENNDKHFIKFSVNDTGVGIKEENKYKLFKPFSKETFNENQLGSGLGLFIVKDVIGKLGGELEFESTYHKGSKFSILIPIQTCKFSPVRTKKSFNNLIKFSNNNLNLGENESFVTNYKEFTPGNFNDEFQHVYPSRRDSQIIFNLSTDNKIELKEIIIDENLPKESLSEVANTNGLLLRSNFDSLKLSHSQMIVEDSKTNFNYLTIIYADDEAYIRKSALRCIKNIAKDLNVEIRILEAEDGIETLYLAYKCLNEGIKIDMIFSDECMNYFKGFEASQYLKKMLEVKNLALIPYYLVTAYEKEFIKVEERDCISEIISKPLNKTNALRIFQNYLIKNDI